MMENTARTGHATHQPGVQHSMPLRRASRGPLVSVILPTYNRRRYLPEALSSVLRQTHRDLELLVVNDGGEPVSDIVQSFGDPRVVFIDRRENRGKPYSLNEALARARGRYIAYLDDDDVYYPYHVETLVNALESETDCQVAYSDLFRSYCDIRPDGRRVILAKHLEISRDFDRFMMFHFNHVLHVSLMHRRDLLDRTGPYNEHLNILIDWDLTRRFAFFTDFHHVPLVTGEYFCPVGTSDRISVTKRRDKREYFKNVMTIRMTRPPKPWPRVQDLAIVLLAEDADPLLPQAMRQIWTHTFYPHRLYVPLSSAEASRMDLKGPNTEWIRVEPGSSSAERVDEVLRQTDAECVAIVPGDLPIGDMWVENAVGTLVESQAPEAFLLDGSRPDRLAVVARRRDLLRARREHPRGSVGESLAAAGISVREAGVSEWPFQFDMLLNQARSAEDEGDWVLAGEIFEYAAAHHGNGLWMRSEAARAFSEAGHRARAATLSREVNRERATVDTLLIEAKGHRQQGAWDTALNLLERAEAMLAHPYTPATLSDERLCADNGFSQG